MKTALCVLVLLAGLAQASANWRPTFVTASWYGEAHRGRLMANGRKFDPNKLTAASWFYPLGAKVRVTINPSQPYARSVLVTVTDRGPAKDLVRQGRKIDLSRAAFRQLADTDLGLIQVLLQRER